MKKHIRLLRASLLCTLTSFLVSGCCALVGCVEPPPSCDEVLPTLKAQESDRRTVILLDQSNSVRAAGDGQAPDFVARLKPILDEAVAAHEVLYIGTFDGSTNSVQWIKENQSTRSPGENPADLTADGQTAGRCLLEAMTAAVAQPPKFGGTDVIGAIDMARQTVEPLPGSKRIVIASDGLPTTGCADLTKTAIGDPAPVDPVVTRCHDERASRPVLKPFELILTGVGHVATDQPQPSPVQAAWLQRLWLELCADMGGGPCAARIDPVPLAHSRSRDVRPVVADPAVSFEEVAPTGSAFSLGTDVLFEPNDDLIKETGLASLAQIARQLVVARAPKVDVNGYTEAQATPEQNYDLARRRAIAVGRELTNRGVAGVEVHASSGTAPRCPIPARTDEDRQCSRRVDITAAAAR